MDTIMLVDDDPAIREIFTIYLEQAGYSTLAAGGGTECMVLLKEHNPDLILLDMMMEPMDGWETLLAIRNNLSSRDIPVIIITGKQPVPEELFRYGGFIENFIVKPIDFALVVAAIRHVIDRGCDLRQEIDRISRDGSDPELLQEYTRLLRISRIVDNVKKRFRDPAWAETTPLAQNGKRLLYLHKQLGLPDRFLEQCDGGNDPCPGTCMIL